MQSHQFGRAAEAARRAASAVRRIPSDGVDPSVVEVGQEWARFLDEQASLIDRSTIAYDSMLETALVSGALMQAGIENQDPVAPTIGILGWIGAVAQLQESHRQLQAEVQRMNAWGRELAARWADRTKPYRE